MRCVCFTCKYWRRLTNQPASQSVSHIVINFMQSKREICILGVGGRDCGLTSLEEKKTELIWSQAFDWTENVIQNAMFRSQMQCTDNCHRHTHTHCFNDGVGTGRRPFRSITHKQFVNQKSKTELSKKGNKIAWQNDRSNRLTLFT